MVNENKTSVCASGQEKYLCLWVIETRFSTFSTTDMYIANLASQFLAISVFIVLLLQRYSCRER